MRGSTLERNLTSVHTVTRDSITQDTWKHMRGFILERNRSLVISAGRDSHFHHTLRITWTSTLERSCTRDQCDKTFLRASNLKKHLRVHTKEKPHSCHLCGKSFSRLDHLKVHQKIHAGVREYMCFECEKTFTTASCLKLHERIQTGEKLYKCSHQGWKLTFFVHRPLWLVDFKIYQPLNVFTSHFLVFNRQCVTACEN